jgi:hypothetical protein
MMSKKDRNFKEEKIEMWLDGLLSAELVNREVRFSWTPEAIKTINLQLFPKKPAYVI